MEFTIAKAEFIRGLSRIQSIIEKRTTLPILSNVLLETKGQSLQVVATDLDVALKASYEANIVDPGVITVGAKKLFEIVRELPDGEVSFKVVANDWVEIVGGAARFKIMGLATDEYPILPDYEDEKYSEISSAALSDMLEKVVHSIGSDEARAYLNGAYVETAEMNGKNFLRAVATDGHRLALCEKELGEGSDLDISRGVIIPKKGIFELKKIIEGEDVPVKVCFTERNAIVRKESLLFIIRLVEGEFPDYLSVIPKNNERTLVGSRDELYAALRRVSLLSEELARGVKFQIATKHLEVSCENPNLGEAREEMAVSYDGEAFAIGFNAKYFIDALSVVKDEDVNLSFNDASSPVIIRAPSDTGFLAVIMPMRL
jgi:DNA polymerase III subunit beta